MKFSHSVVSTGAIFLSFSLGLLACGGGNSNPAPAGIDETAGSVGAIAARCNNPIRGDDTGRTAITDPQNIPVADYTLSRMTMYVYDPANGDSFSASADAQEAFNVRMGDCNQMTEQGRHREKSADVPMTLNASREGKSGDLSRSITLNFENTAVASAMSSTQPDEADSSIFDHIGRGRELTKPNTYISYQSFLTPHGGIEIRSKMELPVNPSTGQSKLIFTSAEYAAVRSGELPPRRP
jgi:hypothetical protein